MAEGDDKHERKRCPRCGRAFICRMGDVTRCQCAAVPLGPNEREYIAGLFSDCLCAYCLAVLSGESALRQR